MSLCCMLLIRVTDIIVILRDYGCIVEVYQKYGMILLFYRLISCIYIIPMVSISHSAIISRSWNLSTILIGLKDLTTISSLPNALNLL